MTRDHSEVILGVDYGKKRMGVAIAFSPSYVVLPLDTLHAGNSIKESAEIIASLSKERKVTCIVIGNPLLLDGKESQGSIAVAELKNHLEMLLNITPILWDERFSSVEAEKILKERHMNRKQRVGKVDSVAASLILSGFLLYSRGIC